MTKESGNLAKVSGLHRPVVSSYHAVMRVLILGGNGLIGSAVTFALARRGHGLVAIGRDIAAASRRMPEIDWRSADVSRFTNVEAWYPWLEGMDAIVNCAGALQDGARDDVKALQETAMLALYAAAKTSGIGLLVQISARTDGAAAESHFLSSKRVADETLAQSGTPFVVLRPALVIGRHCYGGSSLLRALAAFPFVTPLVNADAPIQVTALDDVALAVAQALEGEIPAGSDFDIAAPQTFTLAQIVARHRAWLGLPPASVLAIPALAASAVSRIADLLGWLGWRSPLRSTAMLAVAGGVTITGNANVPFPPKTLDDILGNEAAGVQDLWFARFYLLKPLIIGTLSLYWVVSGAVSLARFNVSTNHLTEVGAPLQVAILLTLATSLADIVLGLGAAVRRTVRPALLGMIGLALCYLAMASILQPSLWLDPLGVLVKVIPQIVLALVALAIVEER